MPPEYAAAKPLFGLAKRRKQMGALCGILLKFIPDLLAKS
jgi:hypothetical protein